VQALRVEDRLPGRVPAYDDVLHGDITERCV
jgi:hypothetical protein